MREAPNRTQELPAGPPKRQPGAPVVSVLMLAYNHAPYLAKAIESVLMQETDFPFELVIGEDCSTDETRSIALDYQRRHSDIVTVITSPTNVGMHENHRRLVRASRGRYIAYCEGDDFWNVADKLARQVEYLDHRPGHSAVHTEFTHLIRSGTHWRYVPRFRSLQVGCVPEGAIFDSLLVSNFIQTCTLMARSALVKEYVASPLSQRRYAVEDWPLCLFLSAYGKIGYIDEPTATYRRVEGSVTNRGATANLVRINDQLRMASEFGAHFGTETGVVVASHSSTMRALFRIALQARDAGRCRYIADWLLSQHQPRRMIAKRAAVHGILSAPGAIHALGIAFRIRAELLERLVYSDASRPDQAVPPSAQMAVRRVIEHVRRRLGHTQ